MNSLNPPYDSSASPEDWLEDSILFDANEEMEVESKKEAEEDLRLQELERKQNREFYASAENRDKRPPEAIDSSSGLEKDTSILEPKHHRQHHKRLKDLEKKA